MIEEFYKPATSRNLAWNLIKTLLQTFVFWLTFLYALPVGIIWFGEQFKIPGFQPLVILGWLLFIAFSTLGVTSGVTMSLIGRGTPLPLDCPQKLVIKGPYKLVRNPMAVAGIGQGISVGLIMGSFLVIAYSLAGGFIWHYYVRPSEEADLQKRFGDGFSEYKGSTWCWMPKMW